MALFQGRILITDCSDKGDRDDVIANILKHKSSRATLYIMVKDFKDIEGMRQKFPTVIPFVLVPGENIERTRRLLKLLPHMDHFVNFLGQELALEFLNKRSDFRIKDVSRVYVRSSVIDKILRSNGQGIIFNINTSDTNCIISDNFVAAGIAAKKSIKGGLKKVFPGASTDEREPLLSKEQDIPRSEPVIDCCHTANANHSSTTWINNIYRFIFSLFYFICPCIDDARVIIPVNEYPIDLDTKIAEAFKDLYRSQDAEWFQKLDDARHTKERAIKQLQNSKEERVEAEYNRLMAVHSELTSTASNRFQAFVNVRDNIRVEKETINNEFDDKTDLLYVHHYHVIVGEQIEMLISFWKKMRLTPS